MPIVLDDDNWLKPRFLRGLTAEERAEIGEWAARRKLQTEDRPNGDLVVAVPAHIVDGFDLAWCGRYPPHADRR